MESLVLRVSGGKDFKGTHAARWLIVPLRVVLACLSNMGVGSVSTLQHSFCPPLTSRRVGLISKTQTKKIYHRQNTTSSRYSDHLMTILTPAIVFCNSLYEFNNIFKKKMSSL